MAKRFIVVCQARSGSTMLMTALQKHPDVCAHGEVLNERQDHQIEFSGLDYTNRGSIIDYLRRQRDAAPAEYLDRYVFFGGGFGAVGFKFKYEELSLPVFSEARRYVLRNRDICVIHMYRDNLWERFLSEYIAVNVTNEFNSEKNSIRVPDISFHLPPERVAESFRQSEIWRSEFLMAFAKHDSLEICYEALISDCQYEFEKVADFLSIKRMNFVPSTKKVRRDKRIEDLVENYQEIRERFNDTRYARFFE